jgi:hypothetical protein
VVESGEDSEKGKVDNFGNSESVSSIDSKKDKRFKGKTREQARRGVNVD